MIDDLTHGYARASILLYIYIYILFSSVSSQYRLIIGRRHHHHSFTAVLDRTHSACDIIVYNMRMLLRYYIIIMTYRFRR